MSDGGYRASKQLIIFSINAFIQPSIIHLSIINLSFYPSLHLSIHPHIHLSLYPLIYPTVHLFLNIIDAFIHHPSIFYPPLHSSIHPFILFPGSCRHALDPGPCREYMVRWYYDPDANACAKFWYGGCLGNSNRFLSNEICRSTCVVA